MGIGGFGTFLGKISQWFPTRRESLNNTVDKLKKELENVQKRKPFNARKYNALTAKLLKAEALAARASD